MQDLPKLEEKPELQPSLAVWPFDRALALLALLWAVALGAAAVLLWLQPGAPIRLAECEAGLAAATSLVCITAMRVRLPWQNILVVVVIHIAAFGLVAGLRFRGESASALIVPKWHWLVLPFLWTAIALTSQSAARLLVQLSNAKQKGIWILAWGLILGVCLQTGFARIELDTNIQVNFWRIPPEQTAATAPLHQLYFLAGLLAATLLSFPWSIDKRRLEGADHVSPLLWAGLNLFAAEGAFLGNHPPAASIRALMALAVLGILCWRKAPRLKPARCNSP